LLFCSEEGVKQLQHVRLDRENIVSISGDILPLLPNVTNLYLQQVGDLPFLVQPMVCAQLDDVALA
jgi:hypothetical protein